VTKRNFELAKKREKVRAFDRANSKPAKPTWIEKLEMARANGRKIERLHILNLLSDYLLDRLPNDDGEVEPSQPNEWDGLEKAIALIKGDK
jgi:hypothetical protein